MNFPSVLFSTEKMSDAKLKKKLSENSFQFVIRKINTDFSSAASLRNCGGKRLCIITLEKGCVACKTVSKEAQSLSAFQVGSRLIKIFLLQFSCNGPLETFFFSFGKYQGSTSHPHPKQTIFQPTGTLLGSFIFQNTSSKFQTVKSVQNNSDFYFQPVPLPHFIYLDLCQ